MDIDRRERSSKDLQLTPTQERVAQSVVDTLQTAQNKTIVVLKGLSGVGKSTVLGKIEDKFDKDKVRVLDPNEIRYKSTGRDIENYRGHLVTTSTVGEINIGDNIQDVAVKRFRGITVETVILPGMDEREILKYISHLQRKSKLNPHQIAQCSIGVPLLADQLSLSRINEMMAAKISARYLTKGFRGKLSGLKEESGRYLQMAIPSRTLVEVDQMKYNLLPQYIYDNLFTVLQGQKEQRAKGVIEESPLFVAAKSERIYNKMLQSSGVASIDIFVPVINDGDFNRLQQAFGFKWGSYTDDQATRLKMFGGSYRKVGFWHRDLQGEEFAEDNEYSEILRNGRAYMQAYQNGELSLEPEMFKDKASFYIHAHEHHGMTDNPAQIGWITESLLQQRGISYFVDNQTYGRCYTYDPASKQICELSDPPDIRKYKFRR